MIRDFKTTDADAVVDVWRAATAVALPFLTADFIESEADNLRNIYLVQGMTFGNPAIGTDVQPLGTLTWSNTREDHDQALADVLRRLPNSMELTRSQLSDVFNHNGLRTLHNKELTRDRVTEPLKRARVILREKEAAQMAANPNFGLF
ncbi:hypothetical protein [Shimia abyssi]|uniref:Uncharacterized protein n=1 Tax=Shimia abyssi TaxID=1662395 RepID=A0A2P8F7P4_9RHOB|nr:hypothetical protein [Shimia abyssi]PSL17741.1 hypothetical protein CLV88_11588 [Shimia abyssi]